MKSPAIQLESWPAEDEERDITASASSSDTQSSIHTMHPDTEIKERPMTKKPNVKSDVKKRKSNLKKTKVIDAFGSQ